MRESVRTSASSCLSTPRTCPVEREQQRVELVLLLHHRPTPENDMLPGRFPGGVWVEQDEDMTALEVRQDPPHHLGAELPLVVPKLREPGVLLDRPWKRPPLCGPRQRRQPDEVGRKVDVGVLPEELLDVVPATPAVQSRGREYQEKPGAAGVGIEPLRKGIRVLTKVHRRRRRRDGSARGGKRCQENGYGSQ